MKKLLVTLALLFGILTFNYACNFTFTILDKKGNVVNPQKVNKGETYTIVVVYKYTHGNCDIPIKDTKFKMDGIKVVSATDWTSENNSYVRKLKVEITENNKEEVYLQAIRTCDRGGASNKIVLKK